MSCLFSQLEKLCQDGRYQREDFLTEIVAKVLQNSKVLTLSWLRFLKATELSDVSVHNVRTQIRLSQLDWHDSGSRPDFEITLGDNEELIYVESKVGSVQGEDQLQRYADHLLEEKKRKGYKRISLIFITHNYEEASVENAQAESLAFRRTRWFEFYNILATHLKTNSDGLAKELKLFMEENHMSLGNQFRSVDLIAMENFHNAKALMDEILLGEVPKKQYEIFHDLTFTAKSILDQLNNHHRYVIYSDMSFDGEPEVFGCVTGFWFPQRNPDQPIWVGVELYSRPNTKCRKAVNSSFQNWIINNPQWKGACLDNPAEWSSIRKGELIHTFLSRENHINAIKTYISDVFDEVKEFKKLYPNLPWSTVTT